jgi:hypothetical protein
LLQLVAGNRIRVLSQPGGSRGQQLFVRHLGLELCHDFGQQGTDAGFRSLASGKHLVVA